MSVASLGVSASYGASAAPNGRGWKCPSILAADRMTVSYQCVERVETESVIVPFTK